MCIITYCFPVIQSERNKKWILFGGKFETPLELTGLFILSFLIHSLFSHTSPSRTDTIQPAANHPASHSWLASDAKQRWSWSVPGWEPSSCWKWCWRASRRQPFLWSPGQWLGTLLSFGWDVKRCPDSLCSLKYPMALIIRVGVLTLVCWLNSQSGPHTIMVT